MRKIISGLAYDTEKSELVHEWRNGIGSTDFHFLSEDLYRTSSGRWFIAYEGGALTQYRESTGSNGYTGSEGIRALSEEDARDWLETHAPAEKFEAHFEAKEA